MGQMDERLYKVFAAMPVKGVFGNYGEASRYRLLARLAGWTGEDRHLADKKIRDNRTVILYPAAYGDKLYLLRDGYRETLKSMDKLDDSDDGAGALLVPAGGLKGNYLAEFPADCEDLYSPVLGSHFMQGLFFEGFPYDKKSFEDLVSHMVMNMPSSVPLRIVLIQNDVQYGATDVTSGEAAITKAIENMKRYTKEILVCSEKEVTARVLDYHIDLRGQYILKKRRMIERVKEELKRDFDMEFQEARERFLLREDGASPGILSSICFMKAADYSKVKGTGMAVEAAVIRNYIEQVNMAKADLKAFVDSVWSRFMYDIAPFSEKDKEEWVQSWIDAIQKDYRQRTLFYCPDNPIEYRRLLTENKIVVELKQYVNNFESRLKSKLYQRIEQQLKTSEGKYI